MSALFDFPSLLVVILLFICTMTFLRSLYPNIFDSNASQSDMDAHSNNSGNMTIGSNMKASHEGLKGICWKASRIGERISPYIAVSCVVMAIHVLFIKP